MVRRSQEQEEQEEKIRQLHGHATTDSEMPFFLSARVTKGYKGDSKQFPHLLRRKSGEVEIGEMPLDSAYLSRRNAQLIANIGAHPYIALKENTSSALSLGYPAWNNMVHEAWENEEEYEEHTIEGLSSRRLLRLQGEVRAERALEDKAQSERRGALQGGSVERACLGVSQLSWVNRRTRR